MSDHKQVTVNGISDHPTQADTRPNSFLDGAKRQVKAEATLAATYEHLRSLTQENDKRILKATLNKAALEDLNKKQAASK